MYQYHCLNPISKVGLTRFSSEYVKTDDISQARVYWFEAHPCMKWSFPNLFLL